MINKLDALHSLRPTGVWGDTSGKFGCDEGITLPTDAEIDAEVIRLQAVYDSQEYARNRQTEYPSIADQLDDIYHNGIDAWKATIKTTKDKYPKP